MAAGRTIFKFVSVIALCLAVVVGGWAVTASPVIIAIEPTDTSRMVHVAGGSFRVSGRSHELPGYWIDQFEVTEADWLAFETERSGPPLEYPAFDTLRGPDFPVRWVSYGQARAFATSLFKSLPTNLQWERAAHGPNDSALPWGDAYVEAANTRDVWAQSGRTSQVTRVGLFERGRSRCGAYDMVGNVWEWTIDTVRAGLTETRDEQTRETRASYDYALADEDAYRLIRGGAFSTVSAGANVIAESVANRLVTRAWDLGFRCVITDDEVAVQEEVIPRIKMLGWTDPWNWYRKGRPAAEALVRVGHRALPYLDAAARACADERVCGRIQEIAQEIREKL